MHRNEVNRLVRHLVGLLIAVLAPVAASGAQLRVAAVWPAADSWITTTEPTCGEVLGRVIRWPSGFQGDTLPTPFEVASIGLADSVGNPARPPSPNAVGTNAAGEFRLRLSTVPRAPITILIRAVGFEPTMISLDLRRYRAFVVEVELRSLGMHVPQLGLSVHAVRGVNICAPYT